MMKKELTPPLPFYFKICVIYIVYISGWNEQPSLILLCIKYGQKGKKRKWKLLSIINDLVIPTAQFK